MRVAFAGDRQVAVDALSHLVSRGVEPVALLLSPPQIASHDSQLRQLAPQLGPDVILVGTDFRQDAGLSTLRSLELDVLLSVHFPFIVPSNVLEIPRLGGLNLHPAYLPFNRGWHTASWALLDGTPLGATMHWMDEHLDTGPIVYQQQLAMDPGSVADSLYQHLNQLELEVFKVGWELVETRRAPAIAQPKGGTFHAKGDLAASGLQRIDLGEPCTAGEVLTRLRALTTNRRDEAAYYEVEGRRFRVTVSIDEEVSDPDESSESTLS